MLAGPKALFPAAYTVLDDVVYRGLDPEISYPSPDILLRQELLRMPIPREFVVRVDMRP